MRISDVKLFGVRLDKDDFPTSKVKKIPTPCAAGEVGGAVIAQDGNWGNVAVTAQEPAGTRGVSVSVGQVATAPGNFLTIDVWQRGGQSRDDQGDAP